MLMTEEFSLFEPWQIIDLQYKRGNHKATPFLTVRGWRILQEEWVVQMHVGNHSFNSFVVKHA